MINLSTCECVRACACVCAHICIYTRVCAHTHTFSGELVVNPLPAHTGPTAYMPVPRVSEALSWPVLSPYPERFKLQALGLGHSPLNFLFSAKTNQEPNCSFLPDRWSGCRGWVGKGVPSTPAAPPVAAARPFCSVSGLAPASLYLHAQRTIL